MARIAVVTPILPVPQDMTRGRFIYETTRALSRIADVRVFLTQAHYPQLKLLQPGRHPSVLADADHTLPGVDIQTVRYPALPLVSRLTNGWVAGRQLLAPIRDFKPDAVIGYWVYPEGAAAQYVARRLKIPSILGALGTDINDRHGLNEWLTRRTLLAADRTIFVSAAMARHATHHYGVSPSRCATIVNGINTAVFHPQDQAAVRAELGVPATERLVVYVGRLIEAKGLRELAQAMQRLRQSGHPTRLVVIGEGDFKAPLQDLIQGLELGGQVRLVGGLVPQEVAKWVNAADFLTLPSWSEGYPNVLVEALACGCPIVATAVGGIPEIVHQDNGVMVQARDAESLFQGFVTAFERKWNRAQIAESMKRTWDDVARETLAVFRDMTP